MARRRFLVVILAAVLLRLGPGLGVGAFGPCGRARATSRSAAGTAYSGNFPDPTVLRVGTTFYAASTTIAALSLPMTTSRDLRTWMPSAVAAPRPTRARTTRCRRCRVGPDEDERAGQGVLADVGSVPGRACRRATRGARTPCPQASDGRRCISVAQGGNPLGPFVDRTTAPADLRDQGRDRPADLPGPWRDVDALQVGRRTGPPGGAPDDRVRRRRSRPAAATSGCWPRAWRGRARTVENPAMIRFRGRLYLFYSANDFAHREVRHRLRPAARP